MNDSDRKFWPFKPRISIITALVLLPVLWLIVAILRARTGWPGERSETAVLIGVLALSLLPLILTLLDIIIERGGAIEFRGVKIDFAHVVQNQQLELTRITVPANIGIRGEPVDDSSSTKILDTLRRATSSHIVIIDLEEGQAWWETRLFVLLAGAQRLKKPDKVVFVGTDAGKQQCFQGWAYATDLFRLLAHADPQYLRSLYVAQAAVRQWELVDPPPNRSSAVPAATPGMHGLAAQHSWMAFDRLTKLPNELFAEQVLASDLGTKVEIPTGSRTITLARLDELFRPVLLKDKIDQSWPNDRQISAFFDSDDPYFAITQDGKYSILVSRLTVLSQMLKSVIQRDMKIVQAPQDLP